MLAFRGVLSGLWSHAMFTSIAAFGVGYFVTRRTKPFATRLAVAIGSFAIAWGCHFFWNSPIGEGNIFLLALRGIPILVVGALLWWLAGRDEGGTLLAIADHYVPDDVITPEERPALGSLRRRRHLRRQARKQHGRKAGPAPPRTPAQATAPGDGVRPDRRQPAHRTGRHRGPPAPRPLRPRRRPRPTRAGTGGRELAVIAAGPQHDLGRYGAMQTRSRPVCLAS